MARRQARSTPKPLRGIAPEDPASPPAATEAPVDPLQAYRADAASHEPKTQESFDKTIVQLSGGALALSIVFLKDIVAGSRVEVGWALAAWISWLLSLASVLASLYLSPLAFRRVIEQVDAGTIRSSYPGGWPSRFIAIANFLGFALFLAGVALFVTFVMKNLEP